MNLVNAVEAAVKALGCSATKEEIVESVHIAVKKVVPRRSPEQIEAMQPTIAAVAAAHLSFKMAAAAHHELLSMPIKDMLILDDLKIDAVLEVLEDLEAE